MIVFQSFIASYPYSMVPMLMKRLELLKAVRERYATMKPDQRIRVIHYENKPAAGAKENKEAPAAP